LSSFAASSDRTAVGRREPPKNLTAGKTAKTGYGMKKSNLVIIGTLAAALLLSGCEQEPKEPSAAEKAAAALAASADFAGKATVSGATVTLTEDVTLTGDIAVAAGVTLDVADKTLTVPAAMKLDVAGEVEVAGQLIIEDGGKNASGTLSGTITVKNGGVFESKGDNPFKDGANGLTLVESGGKAYWKGHKLIVGSASDNAIFVLDDGGSFSFNNTSFVVAGKVAFKGEANFNGEGYPGMYVGSDSQLITLARGAEFTVDAFLSVASNQENGFTLVGASSGAGAAPKIIVGSGGNVYFGDSHTADSNFYPSNTNDAQAFTPAGTIYNWSAEAGGQNKPGWKAASS
jgi:hypothetical protein